MVQKNVKENFQDMEPDQNENDYVTPFILLILVVIAYFGYMYFFAKSSGSGVAAAINSPTSSLGS